MEDTDIRLMLAVKSGDTQSFERLLEKYQKSVLNVIYRYIGDEHLAEDLTQEVFLRVYKARKSYSPDAKFTTWLYKIVINLCLKEFKKKRKLPYSIDFKKRDFDVEPSQYIQDTEPSPPETVEKKEIAEAVKKAVGDLPPNQRMAVVLSKYEGLSYQEIAKSMGISIKAVKSLLSRARANIKKKLLRFLI